MATSYDPPPQHSLADALQNFGDSLGRLLGEHFALAQSELRRESRKLLSDCIFLGIGLLWATVGYLVLMAAAVAALALLLPMWASALIVGAANLIVGGLALGISLRQLRQESRPLPVLSEELKKDAQEIGRVKESFKDRPSLGSHPN